MTEKKRLIQDVLGGLKVPKKQTRQQKKSMKRSEKNIKKNLYDDVLKPLKNSGGGLTEGIKSVKASEKQAAPSKKASEMQAAPSTKASKKQYRGVTKKPLADFKSKMSKKSVTKKLTGGQAKLDKNKNDKIDAEDFKLLREGMALGGSMTRQMTQDMIARAFPKVKGQKQKEQEMYLREKAKYDKPQNMRGGGIAIKGTKFKGVF
tara:strand:+ start:1473 stop:2087 length:615 start_codon:yes stop_codon:yes gene_type:complete